MKTKLRVKPKPAPKTTVFNVEKLRKDFPLLRQKVHGKPLVYLDNAATTQKPLVVIETLEKFYKEYNSNIHRGLHLLSEKATAAYEAVRIKAQAFVNAADPREIIFTRGTTEGINLVAQTWGRQNVGAGDEILVTTMEHHSNIVPWQMLCGEKGAILKVVPIHDDGELDMEALAKLLTPKTKLLAITHVSNALGTINPIADIVRLAHSKGARVLVDGAQAAPHLAVDVRALDCDFYVLSGHKIYGPTGIGILYGKYQLLDSMPPYQGGGDMIASVTFEKTLYKKPPYKFEAGTPNIADTIGLGAALDYITKTGLDNIAGHEQDLLAYGTKKLSEISGLKLVGTASHKAGVLSFTLGEIHPHDIGTILDRQGVAIRAGHHCAQPVMDRYGIPATARASLALYNTRGEIDALTKGIRKVLEVLG
ncbi:MAG TPA: cysteine desulfurase [bacterium]|nr:cysteine desulfurase [bacterium]